MGFYEKHVLPWAVNLACGGKPIATQRGKIVPKAKGKVLEIGVGSGLNLPFYNPDKVEKIWGLEPSEQMRKRAAKVAATIETPVEFLGLRGEDIPLDDASVDTVLVTYTLCTIPDVLAALKQMRRVLKPGAELLFCEHGAAPDPGVRRWQDRLDPIWGKFAGGCHLNRQIDALLNHGGFAIETLETGYIPGPRFAAYNFWGIAKAKP